MKKINLFLGLLFLFFAYSAIVEQELSSKFGTVEGGQAILCGFILLFFGMAYIYTSFKK
jgi:hypothetical protein